MSDFMRLSSIEEVDRELSKLEVAAKQTAHWFAAHNGDALSLLRAMKFEQVGFHPVDGRPLNIIEQVNQTWTFAAAFAAVRVLIERHPDAGGFKLAPGARMSLPLDIMSEAEGLVGGEAFAAVRPENNRKLENDLKKMSTRSESFRYVFFLSPKYSAPGRIEKLERYSVEVWSVAV